MEGDAQGLFDVSSLLLLKRWGGRNREDLDFRLFNLIPCLKNFQSPLVPFLNRKTDSGFRMQAHQLPCYSLKRVTDGPNDQFIDLPDRIPGEGMGQGVSIHDSVRKENIHHALFKPLPNLFDDLVIHGSMLSCSPSPSSPPARGGEIWGVNNLFLLDGRFICCCRTVSFPSFRRKPESSKDKGTWTPAFAGVTAFYETATRRSVKEP